jgi:hypothetical protein
MQLPDVTNLRLWFLPRALVVPSFAIVNTLPLEYIPGASERKMKEGVLLELLRREY